MPSSNADRKVAALETKVTKLERSINDYKKTVKASFDDLTKQIDELFKKSKTYIDDANKAQDTTLSNFEKTVEASFADEAKQINELFAKSKTYVDGKISALEGKVGGAVQKSDEALSKVSRLRER